MQPKLGRTMRIKILLAIILLIPLQSYAYEFNKDANLSEDDKIAIERKIEEQQIADKIFEMRKFYCQSLIMSSNIAIMIFTDISEDLTIDIVDNENLNRLYQISDTLLILSDDLDDFGCVDKAKSAEIRKTYKKVKFAIEKYTNYKLIL